ncbi:hypothetical protein OPT61_g4283 [Boeremia exigua]|uniref:Uncharacterized protein n=1 Tax=Boeremia exigua TaxID=749465 RepID=A0ACC2IEM8_9PLEO|nr:hypothetical protein OPT61_g4283 [Boeremia exigua]
MTTSNQPDATFAVQSIWSVMGRDADSPSDPWTCPTQNPAAYRKTSHTNSSSLTGFVRHRIREQSGLSAQRNIAWPHASRLPHQVTYLQRFQHVALATWGGKPSIEAVMQPDPQLYHDVATDKVSFGKAPSTSV